MSAPSIEELRGPLNALWARSSNVPGTTPAEAERFRRITEAIHVALDELARLRELQRSIVGEDGRLFMSAPLAQWDELRAENERLRAALESSIVGTQSFNWSEHAYPLVAALNEAGFEGLPYPKARENVGTLLERIAALDSALAAARAEIERERGRSAHFQGEANAATERAETAERELENARAQLDIHVPMALEYERAANERDQAQANLKCWQNIAAENAHEARTAGTEANQYREAEAHKHRLMVEAWGERDQAQANLKDITEKLLRAEGREAAMREALRPVRVAFLRDIVGIDVRDCANGKQLTIWNALDALIGDTEGLPHGSLCHSCPACVPSEPTP